MSFAGFKQFHDNLNRLMASKNFDPNNIEVGYALLNSKYGKGSKVTGKVHKLPNCEHNTIKKVKNRNKYIMVCDSCDETITKNEIEEFLK